MAPGVGTASIRALDEAVVSAGGLGTKICGAGGGGCVLILLPDAASSPAVDAAIAAGPWEPLPLELTAAGLDVGPLSAEKGQQRWAARGPG
jgi:D-glycero-alpha-D-manno-heptose-7-phosphate kinase